MNDPAQRTLWLLLALAAAVWLQPEIAGAATRTVSNLNDSGPGSLRNTIVASASDDTINFAIRGTITLTNGELFITNNLNIVGPGATNLAISGNRASRVLEIGPNVTVTISSLTIRDGQAFGGAKNSKGGGIYNAGSLTLFQCALLTNTAAGDSGSGCCPSAAEDGTGGGVYNAGFLVVQDGLLQGNVAQGGSGVLLASPSRPGEQAGNGFGGAIYNAGGLSIRGSTF